MTFNTTTSFSSNTLSFLQLPVIEECKKKSIPLENEPHTPPAIALDKINIPIIGETVEDLFLKRLTPELLDANYNLKANTLSEKFTSSQESSTQPITQSTPSFTLPSLTENQAEGILELLFEETDIKIPSIETPIKFRLSELFLYLLKRTAGNSNRNLEILDIECIGPEALSLLPGIADQVNNKLFTNPLPLDPKLISNLESAKGGFFYRIKIPATTLENFNAFKKIFIEFLATKATVELDLDIALEALAKSINENSGSQFQIPQTFYAACSASFPIDNDNSKLAHKLTITQQTKESLFKNSLNVSFKPILEKIHQLVLKNREMSEEDLKRTLLLLIKNNKFSPVLLRSDAESFWKTFLSRQPQPPANIASLAKDLSNEEIQQALIDRLTQCQHINRPIHPSNKYGGWLESVHSSLQGIRSASPGTEKELIEASFEILTEKTIHSEKIQKIIDQSPSESQWASVAAYFLKKLSNDDFSLTLAMLMQASITLHRNGYSKCIKDLWCSMSAHLELIKPTEKSGEESTLWNHIYMLMKQDVANFEVLKSLLETNAFLSLHQQESPSSLASQICMYEGAPTLRITDRTYYLHFPIELQSAWKTLRAESAKFEQQSLFEKINAMMNCSTVALANIEKIQNDSWPFIKKIIPKIIESTFKEKNSILKSFLIPFINEKNTCDQFPTDLLWASALMNNCDPTSPETDTFQAYNLWTSYRKSDPSTQCSTFEFNLLKKIITYRPYLAIKIVKNLMQKNLLDAQTNSKKIHKFIEAICSTLRDQKTYTDKSSLYLKELSETFNDDSINRFILDLLLTLPHESLPTTVHTVLLHMLSCTSLNATSVVLAAKTLKNLTDKKLLNVQDHSEKIHAFINKICDTFKDQNSYTDKSILCLQELSEVFNDNSINCLILNRLLTLSPESLPLKLHKVLLKTLSRTHLDTSSVVLDKDLPNATHLLNFVAFSLKNECAAEERKSLNQLLLYLLHSVQNHSEKDVNLILKQFANSKKIQEVLTDVPTQVLEALFRIFTTLSVEDEEKLRIIRELFKFCVELNKKTDTPNYNILLPLVEKGLKETPKSKSLFYKCLMDVLDPLKIALAKTSDTYPHLKAFSDEKTAATLKPIPSPIPITSSPSLQTLSNEKTTVTLTPINSPGSLTSSPSLNSSVESTSFSWDDELEEELFPKDLLDIVFKDTNDEISFKENLATFAHSLREIEENAFIAPTLLYFYKIIFKLPSTTSPQIVEAVSQTWESLANEYFIKIETAKKDSANASDLEELEPGLKRLTNASILLKGKMNKAFSSNLKKKFEALLKTCHIEEIKFFFQESTIKQISSLPDPFRKNYLESLAKHIFPFFIKEPTHPTPNELLTLMGKIIDPQISMKFIRDLRELSTKTTKEVNIEAAIDHALYMGLGILNSSLETTELIKTEIFTFFKEAPWQTIDALKECLDPKINFFPLEEKQVIWESLLTKTKNYCDSLVPWTSDFLDACETYLYLLTNDIPDNELTLAMCPTDEELLNYLSFLCISEDKFPEDKLDLTSDFLARKSKLIHGSQSFSQIEMEVDLLKAICNQEVVSKELFSGALKSALYLLKRLPQQMSPEINERVLHSIHALSIKEIPDFCFDDHDMMFREYTHGMCQLMVEFYKRNHVRFPTFSLIFNVPLNSSVDSSIATHEINCFLESFKNYYAYSKSNNLKTGFVHYKRLSALTKNGIEKGVFKNNDLVLLEIIHFLMEIAFDYHDNPSVFNEIFEKSIQLLNQHQSFSTDAQEKGSAAILNWCSQLLAFNSDLTLKAANILFDNAIVNGFIDVQFRKPSNTELPFFSKLDRKNKEQLVPSISTKPNIDGFRVLINGFKDQQTFFSGVQKYTEAISNLSMEDLDVVCKPALFTLAKGLPQEYCQHFQKNVAQIYMQVIQKTLQTGSPFFENCFQNDFYSYSFLKSLGSMLPPEEAAKFCETFSLQDKLEASICALALAEGILENKENHLYQNIIEQAIDTAITKYPLLAVSYYTRCLISQSKQLSDPNAFTKWFLIFKESNKTALINKNPAFGLHYSLNLLDFIITHGLKFNSTTKEYETLSHILLDLLKHICPLIPLPIGEIERSFTFLNTLYKKNGFEISRPIFYLQLFGDLSQKHASNLAALQNQLQNLEYIHELFLNKTDTTFNEYKDLCIQNLITGEFLDSCVPNIFQQFEGKDLYITLTQQLQSLIRKDSKRPAIFNLLYDISVENLNTDEAFACIPVFLEKMKSYYQQKAPYKNGYFYFKRSADILTNAAKLKDTSSTHYKIYHDMLKFLIKIAEDYVDNYFVFKEMHISIQKLLHYEKPEMTEEDKVSYNDIIANWEAHCQKTNKYFS